MVIVPFKDIKTKYRMRMQTTEYRMKHLLLRGIVVALVQHEPGDPGAPAAPAPALAPEIRFYSARERKRGTANSIRFRARRSTAQPIRFHSGRGAAQPFRFDPIRFEAQRNKTERFDSSLGARRLHTI